MPPNLVGLLLCPLCACELRHDDRAYRCASGHTFDLARQGYVNLLTGKGTRFVPDTAEMVRARVDFLGAGHYDSLRRQLLETLRMHHARPEVILDAGAGTGYYLQAFANEYPHARSVAMDISRHALVRAASAVPSALSVVWDVWRPLPLPRASVDLLLNIFSPRNPSEFSRVVRAGGLVLTVTPLPGHLGGLAGLASVLTVPADKADDVERAFSAGFTELARITIEYPLRLSGSDAWNAVLMGPSAHHIDRDQLRSSIAQLRGSLDVQARFCLQAFQRG